MSDLSGARIAGARVSLSNGAAATADATGAYTIATLVPGTYTATASAAGYANSAATTVVIVNGSTTTQDFKLSPLPGSIQGVVTDASGVVKIAGATRGVGERHHGRRDDDDRGVGRVCVRRRVAPAPMR